MGLTMTGEVERGVFIRRAQVQIAAGNRQFITLDGIGGDNFPGRRDDAPYPFHCADVEIPAFQN